MIMVDRLPQPKLAPDAMRLGDLGLHHRTLCWSRRNAQGK